MKWSDRPAGHSLARDQRRHPLQGEIQVWGPEDSDVGCLRKLVVENSKLQWMYADVSLESQAWEDLIPGSSKVAKHAEAVNCLVAQQKASLGRACDAVGLFRASWYKPPQARLERDRAVIQALTNLAGEQ